MVFQGERAFVVGALAVMSGVVFLDVLHRTFSTEENKGVAAFAKLLSYFGQDIERGSAAYTSLESWFPYVLWVGFVALGAFGIRTAKQQNKVPLPKAIAFSAAGVVAVYGLIRLFVSMMPNGLIWSQRLALVLTLWVGFVAASMCTYENKHLKVEAAQRAIPDSAKPYVSFLSALFTTLVCFGLMWLSTRFVLRAHDDYLRSEGRGGLVEGLGLPLYQALAVLPLSFSIMSVRFLARGIFALGGELPETPSIEGLDQLEKYQASEDPKPSDVPTEVGSVSDELPSPQSKVQTDPHSAATRAGGDDGEEDKANEDAVEEEGK